MKRKLSFIILALLLAVPAIAEEEHKDLATGEGLMYLPTGNTDPNRDKWSDYVKFEPEYAYAYAGKLKGQDRRWLLLADVNPTTIDWTKSQDRIEVLRQWCQSAEAGFVLVELDLKGKPQLVIQCPANGMLAYEMISTTNGLDSVVIDFVIDDGKRMKGRLQGGEGNCGDMKYCDLTKDYYFDVTLSK